MLIDRGRSARAWPSERGLSRSRRRAGWSAGAAERTASPPPRRCATGHAGVRHRRRRDLAALVPVLDGLGARLAIVAALPLIVSGRPLGCCWSTSFAPDASFDVGERDLLEALATQSAIALARAQLYEREHAVAQTLQASLLPRALPDDPWFWTWRRGCTAGTPGLDVGGDFYDAFALRRAAWGLAIGDVCGKGVDAAALTALARHTMRAAAQRGPPAERRAARARTARCWPRARPGEFLTAIFARARRARRRRFRPRVGLRRPPAAGPARPRRDGRSRSTARARCWACSTIRRSPTSRPALTPGDVLLLYTDGLTEAGAPQRTLTTDDVGRAARRAAHGSPPGDRRRCLARALGGWWRGPRRHRCTRRTGLAPRP